MKCGHKGCNELQKSKGYCLRHYKLFWKYGDTKERGARHASPEERFYRHVEKSEAGCWNWTGYKDKDGYGTITVKKGSGHTPIRAHRFSLQMHRPDEKSEGMMVLHKCNNPSCVNPDHLYYGDICDNVRDALEAGHIPMMDKHKNAKITKDQAREIRASSGPADAVANKYGISASQVRNIRRKLQWRNLED